MRTETSGDTWYERAAWIFFAVFSGGVLPMAVLYYLDPSAATGLWERFGYALPAAVAGDAAAIEYVAFISHWATTGTIGFDLFALLVALTAFRRGERWAWFAFLYWPALFTTHFFTYQSSFRYAQLVWVTLSVAALLATYRKVFGRAPVRAGAMAAT